MGLTSTSFTSENQPTHIRIGRPKSPATIVKDAIFTATGKDLEAYWAWVVEQSQKEGGESFVRLIVERTTPTLKAQMQTVNIDGFPRNGSAIDQAEAVLIAVTQGVIPLDFAGPMLAMIQLIDTAKGGTLGNSGLDLSALYQGTDSGLKAASNFAAQIAALQPRGQVIDVTPTQQQSAQTPEPITVALQREADAIDARTQDVAEHIEAAAARLATLYPANTPTSIYNGIVDLLNAASAATEDSITADAQESAK